MSSAEINRKFSIIGYTIFILVIVLGLIEVILLEKYFYIPLFTFFIFAYIIGIISAIQYQLLVERKVCQTCIVILTITALSMLVLVHEIDSVARLTLQMVAAFKVFWFIHRCACLGTLQDRVEKLYQSAKDIIAEDDNLIIHKKTEELITLLVERIKGDEIKEFGGDKGGSN